MSRADSDPENFGEVVRPIRALLPRFKMDTILDVGANVGQSVDSFLTFFPDCRILAFEPAPETFASLVATQAKNSRVSCYQWALGAREEMRSFRNKGTSTMNRIVDVDSGGTLQVDVRTGDAVCQKLGIEHVSYLKIDTEGFDLDVLQGFEGMLAKNAIDFVETETGLNPDNQYFCPLESVRERLGQFGYRIFRFRHQSYERLPKDGTMVSAPLLRYCNTVFISRRLVESRDKFS